MIARENREIEFRHLIAHFLVILAMASGCASPDSATERARLSERFEQQTGHSLSKRAGADATFEVPPGLEVQPEVTETDAIKLALWNNPLFQENLSKLGVSRADVIQAGLFANPTISILFPWGPKQLEYTATFPLEALYLRPQRLKAARLDADKIAQGLLQSGLDLIRDVRLAFADLWLAEERARLGAETLETRDALAQIATVRLRVGEGSELDRAAARAEASRTADEKRRAEQAATLARERVVFLIGASEVAPKFQVRAEDCEGAALGTIEDLGKRALVCRPDLRASELTMEAAAERAGLAKKEIFMISGVIDANGSGKEGFEMGPGAQLALPIFHQNQAGRARATAEMERAAWNYAGTRQRIVFEVRDAYRRYDEARGALETFRTDVLPKTRAVAEEARRAYELGEIAPMLVHEYSRQLILARLTEADFKAAFRRALAELERSVGSDLRKRQKPEPE